MINTYEEFIKEVKKLTGLDLALYKERQMKRRINSLISRDGYDDYSDYMSALISDKKVLNKFLRHITINVSEFFRNLKHWEILQNEILPSLLQKSKNIKIWSAACSTGEEPYSIAMTLSKYIPLSSINILATDIDDEVIEKAKIGIYTKKSVESVPKEFLEKYFVNEGEVYRVKDEIKKCVTFKKHNLLADPYPSDNDLIVCRNVMIYFTEEAKENIYKSFNSALKVGGILFVGSTEQIIMCNKYNFSSSKTFFYKKES